ncbi:MAG: BON domain-containing protein [Anaeromyxobacter sp.]
MARVGTARGPRGWRRPDLHILDELVERIVRAGLDASDVVVEVVGGEVWLHGSVVRTEDRDRMEAMAAGVLGVRAVHALLSLTQDEEEVLEPDPETRH